MKTPTTHQNPNENKIPSYSLDQQFNCTTQAGNIAFPVTTLQLQFETIVVVVVYDKRLPYLTDFVQYHMSTRRY